MKPRSTLDKSHPQPTILGLLAPLLLGVALLAAPFVSVAGATPILEIDGKITFQANRDGNGEVYVMFSGGSSQTRLTNDAGDDHYGRYSPDGSKIVFRSNRTGNSEIFVMRADKTGVTNVSNNAANEEAPVWSPDGSKIAFYSVRDATRGIYIMNADGTDERVVPNTESAGRADWQPVAAGSQPRSSRGGE